MHSAGLWPCAIDDCGAMKHDEPRARGRTAWENRCVDRSPARHPEASTTIMVLISSAALALAIAGTSACVDEPKLTLVADPDADTATTDGAAGTDGGGDGGGIIDDTVVARAACAAACPGAGGTCDGAICVIACPGSAACAAGVTCPAGVACHVTCDGKLSCKGVDCATATFCKIDCNGESSCGPVAGEALQAEITCTGKDACKDARCGGDTCTVQCANEGCKAGEVRCCAKQQCTVNGAPGRCR